MVKVPSQYSSVEDKDPDMVKIASRRTIPGMVMPDEYNAALQRCKGFAQVEKDLLPVEAEEGAKVRQEVRDSVAALRALQCRQAITNYSNHKYQLLDLAPLKWRSGQNGLPIFGVFGLNNPITGWTATRGNFLVEDANNVFNVRNKVNWIAPVPRVIQDCYADILQIVWDRLIQVRQTLFSNISIQEIQVSLRSRFSGLIPAEVKTEICRARNSKLFQGLYMVAEVKEWKWDEIVVSRRGDPLIIGNDTAGQIWLIKAFDTTSVEELFRSEFCTKAEV